jgi:hypothetical protein
MKRERAFLSSPRQGAILGLLLAAGLTGCGDDPVPSPAAPGSPFEADNAYPADHPLAAGQRAFLHDSWGTEVLGEWPPADFFVGLMESGPAMFRDQFVSFGFIADPGDDFPVGFKRGLADPTRVKETCALCHVAELPDGRFWMGAPNTRLDFARFRLEVNARWVAAGNPPLITPLEEEKLGKIGPGRTGAESREYPDLVPVDFPPYFNLGKRAYLNYLGTGHNVRTEAYFSLYTFGAGAPNKEEAIVPFPDEERVDEFIEFLGSLDAPAPPAQDPALVAAGEAVFAAAACDACHHVAIDDLGLDVIIPYDKEQGGKDRIPGQDPAFPRGTIHTDALHRVILEGDSGSGPDDGFLDLLNFIQEHGLEPGWSDGYRTSSVRGLWASAPYLHNGSVPTLDALLRPAAERPTQWQNGAFELDTTQLGNSAQGHELGTDLSEPDREALIAYLLSL